MVESAECCSQCGSDRLYKDGLRYTNQGPIQRWLCRSCGYRFSESKVKLNIPGKLSETFNPRSKDFDGVVVAGDGSVKEASDNLPFSFGEDVSSHKLSIVEKGLNTFPLYNSKRQVCATEKGAKNLETATETRTVAGEESQRNVKGKIIEFAWWMQKQGYAQDTTKNRGYMLKRLLDLGADLNNPESIKEVLARQKWTESYKAIMVDAYTLFLKWQGREWEQPRYKITTSMAFIPTELELDQFIAASTKTKAAYLQGLKDTGCDPGELGALRWIDVNAENRTVTVNFPVRGHNKRVLTVSEEFIRRINALPKRTERVFNYRNIRTNFFSQRKVIARKLENPRILEISFTTFRHWKGTTEYHKTRDLLHVQRLLGHKKIDNTLIYIDYEKALFGNGKADEFTVRVAANTDEACSLVESGFEYVTGEYVDGGKIFRKRK